MAVAPSFNPSIFHPFYFIRKGILEAISAHADSMKGVMMDFGCGSKPYQSLFHVEQYIGVDFDGGGHSHHNEHIDVFYDGSHIPFPDNHFDSILCSEVFEHLFNLEFVLRELKRVLKPGGRMLITCPFVWNEHEAPFDYARYTRFALDHLFTANGFTVLQQGKKGTNIQTLHQLRSLYAVTVGYSIKKALPALGFLGSVYTGMVVPYINVRGKLLNAIIPAQYELYLTNYYLVTKE